MPLILLPFLGSGFVPTDSMPTGLRWFAEYQPFTPIIETLRGLLMGTADRQQRGHRRRLVRRHRPGRLPLGPRGLQPRPRPHGNLTQRRNRACGPGLGAVSRAASLVEAWIHPDGVRTAHPVWRHPPGGCRPRAREGFPDYLGVGGAALTARGKSAMGGWHGEAFNGVINLDVRDSVADWGPYLAEEAPRGRAERADRALRRHGPGGVVAVRRADRDADDAAPRRQRPDLQPVAHDGAVLADALVLPDRPQPPPERVRADRRGRPGVPRPHGAHPDGERGAGRGACARRAGTRSGSARTTTSRSTSGRWAATKRNWPLARGFDRFYGFIGGETNQWYPDLVEDNHYVEQPYTPEEGYHLSKDLADKALGFIRDSKQSHPDKPWFLWFCPGANHAPHHAPQEYIDKYKGEFDDGYEAYREWVLPRMIEKGIMPEGTELTPLNPLPEGQVVEADAVRPWDSLSDDEKRLFARMAEVYAGFSEYTDAQVGRIVDYLEESGQLDNTIVFYCADNGASGEGSPDGSVNENKFFNAWPDDIEQNLAMLDQLGSPKTYNHYPTGWAAAFSTPFRMFKRYTYQGGVCDPLVISWPAGIEGARRGPAPVPPRDRHRPDDPRVLRGRVPRLRAGLRADPAARRVDALQLRRRRRADGQEGPVLRDVRHPRAVARRLEGRRRARADDRHRRLRERHLAALPHRRGPLGGARPRRPAPRQGPAARRPVVRRGRQVRRAAARRPHASPSSSRSSPRR